ncbi:hypothetical protein VEE57_07310 [Escherichia coli]|nr:hypothetical protein VEE57_07310 [Escherichia coli]
MPVLDRRDILDYVECISNGRWYEPPVSFTGLAKSLRAAVHHSSPIYVKRNILASTFIPHPWLSQQDFSRFALDFLVFGNAFLEKRYSTTGKVIRLETSPAKYTRRGVEEDVYWWVPSFNEPTAFTPGSVFHLLEPDINQELYGLPEYLSALNSAWLNESATAVPPQVLRKWRTCRIHHVRHRCRAGSQRYRNASRKHGQVERPQQL